MFVYPYFVVPGEGVKRAIPSMPGIHHFSVDELLKDVEAGLKVGVNKLLLFGAGEEKSADAPSAYDPHSVVPEALRRLRESFGDRSEEHTSELQSLMRSSYAVFCFNNKKAK